MGNWNRVEDFKNRHGHLPSESSAPCKACFNERTAAEIKVRQLEDRLKVAEDVVFNVQYLFGKGNDLKDLRESLEDYDKFLKDSNVKP